MRFGLVQRAASARQRTGDVDGQGNQRGPDLRRRRRDQPRPIIAVTLMLFSRRARRMDSCSCSAGSSHSPSSAASPTSLPTRPAPPQTAQRRTPSPGKDRLRRPLPPAGRLQLAHPPGARYRAEMPKWIAGIDTLKPGNALGLGLLLAGVNPKNLMLTAAAVSVLRPLGVQVHRKRARQHHPDGMSDRMRRASLTLRPEWLIAVTDSGDEDRTVGTAAEACSYHACWIDRRGTRKAPSTQVPPAQLFAERGREVVAGCDP